MTTLKLPPYFDPVFLLLFNEDNHCRLLISLLNSLLNLPRALRIVGLDIISPRIMGQTVAEKHVVLDIRAHDITSRRFNIEVQVASFSDYAQRILYYWAGMYHGQIQMGQGYGRLQPAYAIHITGFKLFPQRPRYHFIFQPRDHLEPEVVLSDHQQIHVFELPKFQLPLEQLRTPAEKWVYFIKCGHQMSPDEIAGLAMPELLEAEEKLTMISQEERLRIQHEQWEKALRDQASFEQDWIAFGQRKGHELGLKEGVKEGIKKGIKRGIKKGRTEGLQTAVLDLCEVLGISLSAAQLQQIEGMDADALTALRAHLKRHRAWPAE